MGVANLSHSVTSFTQMDTVLEMGSVQSGDAVSNLGICDMEMGYWDTGESASLFV